MASLNQPTRNPPFKSWRLAWKRLILRSSSARVKCGMAANEKRRNLRARASSREACHVARYFFGGRRPGC